jgi:diguanylate cyclase (GGDEF)-like protein
MIELPNLARLFLALFLLSLWLARPANKTPLYWSIAYLGLAAGSALYLQGMAQNSSVMLQLAPLGPAIYVGLFWAGALSFEERRIPWRTTAILAAASAAIISLALNTSDLLGALAVGIAVAAVTSAAAWIIWRKNRQYRVVAVILFAQAVLLALTYALIWRGPAATHALAAGYSFLAIGLTYVILKESNETVERQATIDEVTGLPNRRLFLELLDGAVRALPGPAYTTAALIISIDNLKHVGYTLGHEAADHALKEIGARLKQATPNDRTLARFGLDEFALLVPRVEQAQSGTQLEAESERITAALKAPFDFADHSRTFTASIGIAISLEEAGSTSELLDHLKATAAQLAQRGRTTRSIFNRTMSARAQRLASIEQGLWQFREAGHFALYYQPVVSAAHRGLSKVEALMRWTDKTLGEVAPDEFIPVAEQSGCIIELGRWVLDEACRQARSWNDERAARGAEPIVMCVNVSGLQVRRADFADEVAGALSKHGLSPKQLELELTENVLLGDDEVVHSTLRDLHELGVSLSLDDFGTGFSSLSYLNRFEFNTLKIDKSFVSEIDLTERSKRLAESICALGKSLDLSIVAEGVETEASAAILKSYGVDYLQGYLFGRPEPAEALSAKLTDSR